MFTVVIPVYKNAMNIGALLQALGAIREQLDDSLEVVFVVDGSPDDSYEILRKALPSTQFRSNLLCLSRNFGAFSAIAAGLQAGSGDNFGVLAADLQEPPELILDFARILSSDTADVVFGCRAGRTDPWPSEIASSLFWWIYRRFVVREMPAGGVDVFACTRRVRDHLLQLKEVNTNLIALLFWLGFRREFVSYVRLPRLQGKSAWTLSKKVRYCLDSLFSLTDLPIKFLLYMGAIGVTLSILLSTLVIVVRFSTGIPVPGYTTIVLAILFFGGLSSLGMGILGEYLWLALQNSRNRPSFIVSSSMQFPPANLDRAMDPDAAEASSRASGEPGRELTPGRHPFS